MRNFLKIGDLQVLPLLAQIFQQPELWNRYTVRTHHPMSAHRTVDDIILRYNAFDKGDDFVEKVCAEIQVFNYPPFDRLPAARGIVFSIMAMLQGEHLGRVFISRIKPGGEIAPHSDRIGPAEEQFPDRIPPALYYKRYHVVLQAEAGCLFTCGDEQVYMPPGTAWWFNNNLEHSVINNSANDRIHLVVDISSGFNGYEPT